MERLRTLVLAVRGTRYYQCYEAIRGGCLALNAIVVLRHEPTNPHDPNAVAFFLLAGNRKIGHVGRELAPKYRRLLKAGAVKSARVVKVDTTIDQQGRRPIVHVAVTYVEPETEEVLTTWQICAGKIALFDPGPGVYTISCTSTKRIYVGESGNVRDRMRNHFAELVQGNHGNRPLQMDFRTYGPKAFVLGVVGKYADATVRKAVETTHITDLLARGCKLYNMTSDGQGRLPSEAAPSDWHPTPPISDWIPQRPNPATITPEAAPPRTTVFVPESRVKGARTAKWITGFLVLLGLLALAGR
jgi:hypothetical protein